MQTLFCLVGERNSYLFLRNATEAELDGSRGYVHPRSHYAGSSNFWPRNTLVTYCR